MQNQNTNIQKRNFIKTVVLSLGAFSFGIFGPSGLIQLFSQESNKSQNSISGFGGSGFGS